MEKNTQPVLHIAIRFDQIE